jgi:hypothetical protein
MASTDISKSGRNERPFTNPWPALVCGLGATVASLLWLKIFGSMALPLVLGGVLAAGIAVAIRPQSPVVLGLVALCGLMATEGLTWDSGKMLLVVLSGVAALGALLMLLPCVVRRIVISLMILVHFGGILSAVLSVPPTPWVSTAAWAYFYKPYLEFFYLNNAYHFYSPEPGPGTLLWFYVKYEDGSGQWYKIPNWEENPVALEYQRRLSLAESINQLAPMGTVPVQVMYSRHRAANELGIYMHPDVPEYTQWRQPVPFSKRMLETYARFVCRNLPHPTDASQKVTGVKIYRVIHNILHPRQIAEGMNPEDKTLYYPYYQGEFTPEGVLKDPEDPLLYWLIPIYRKPGPLVIKIGRGSRAENGEIVDFLEQHIKLNLKKSETSPVEPDKTAGK